MTGIDRCGTQRRHDHNEVRAWRKRPQGQAAKARRIAPNTLGRAAGKRASKGASCSPIGATGAAGVRVTAATRASYLPDAQVVQRHARRAVVSIKNARFFRAAATLPRARARERQYREKRVGIKSTGKKEKRQTRTRPTRDGVFELSTQHLVPGMGQGRVLCQIFQNLAIFGRRDGGVGGGTRQKGVSANWHGSRATRTARWTPPLGARSRAQKTSLQSACLCSSTSKGAKEKLHSRQSSCACHARVQREVRECVTRRHAYAETYAGLMPSLSERGGEG